MRPFRFALAAATAVAVAVLTFGEVTHWRASRRRLGSPSARGTEAIVVLGYGNRGPRANRENRYRVRAGLRSIDPTATRSILVFCGGTVEGPIPEAEIMEAYARDELGYRGPSVLEPTSRSTWQNIENAIPLIEAADVIKIVSNSVHAELARGYLWMLRPDLAARLASPRGGLPLRRDPVGQAGRRRSRPQEAPAPPLTRLIPRLHLPPEITGEHSDLVREMQSRGR